jgi:hypothetical protein
MSKEEQFALIKAAVERRNAFLAEYPELQSLQDEIDEKMKKAGSALNRCAVLHRLMRENLNKIVDLCGTGKK